MTRPFVLRVQSGSITADKERRAKADEERQKKYDEDLDKLWKCLEQQQKHIKEQAALTSSVLAEPYSSQAASDERRR